MPGVNSVADPAERAAPLPPGGSRLALRRRLAAGWRIVSVRLRFLAVFLVIFVVVGKWDTLGNYWDRLTRKSSFRDTPVSQDTEYWCPMCPGIVSEWPAKCPVCNMDLVRRRKTEPVPLPDGVMARMQFSPYQVQLAGIRTSPVSYQPLVRDVRTAGFVAGEPPLSRVGVSAEVFEKDIPLLEEGQPVEIVSEAFPGRAPFVGRVRELRSRLSAGVPSFQVRLEIDNPRHELRPGMFVTARVKVPAAHLGWVSSDLAQQRENATAADLAVHAVLNPAGAIGPAGIASLVRNAGQQVLQGRGLVLAVPESAVVDTGADKVVYIERGPGMFDGVAVVLGPRCGEFYPVLRGLEAGQRVAAAGAFLIDAETRLNPAAASMYFGGSTASPDSRPAAALARQADEPQEAKIKAALAELDPEDRALADAQRFCPVRPKTRLGQMGKPFKVTIKGRPVFLCCDGCEDKALANPDETVAKVEELKGAHVLPPR